MSSFVIKIIAIITMLIDHSGDALVGHLSIMNIIGRIAFPLFAFQLVIGYSHTKNLKKYCMRLFLFALIFQIPFSLFTYSYTGNFTGLNIFFTLLLGIITMYIYDLQYETLIKAKHINKILFYILKFVCIAIIVAIAQFINIDYQAAGIILILFIHILYPMKNKLPFILFMLAFSIFSHISIFSQIPIMWSFGIVLFTFLPTIFMLLYNGKKGHSLKYFFYAFYPIHLLILLGLHYIIYI